MFGSLIPHSNQTSRIYQNALQALVLVTTHFICCGIHHTISFMPWYTPCQLHAFVHTRHALVHTTTQLICFDTYHMLWYATLLALYTLVPMHHFTLHNALVHTLYHMPWYMPYVLVCTAMHLTYQQTPDMLWYTLLHTLNALVHTTTHITCLGTYHCTHYMHWYIPLHPLHALVAQCVTPCYIVHNS